MKPDGYLDIAKQTTLVSARGLALFFKVKITDAGYPKCRFEVHTEYLNGQPNKACSFELQNREHQSYLDLFENLSKEIGLRLPQNREKSIYQPVATTPLQEVLTENITPDILYGYGDPAVIKVENETGILYYLIATSNDAPNSFPILRSKNLKDWDFVNFVFPEGKKPEWAADGEFRSDYWAAEMHQVGDEFRVYFVAREKESSELCIGVANAGHPEGPFIAVEQPVLKGNIIDPHVYVEDQDTAYLYWKEDNNDVWPGKLVELLYNYPALVNDLFDKKEDQATAIFVKTIWPWIKMLPPMERFLALQVFIEAIISNFTSFYQRLQRLEENQSENLKPEINLVLGFMKTPMYAQRLSKDGLNLEGKPTKILENDLKWEAHLVEGMWVIQHSDNYYLFYAGNDFSTDQYGIGVAIGKSPLGPFIKMQTPFLQSTAKWWAPGHPSVVTGIDGTPVMFLHAFFPGKAGYKQFRALLSVPLIFKENQVQLEI